MNTVHSSKFRSNAGPSRPSSIQELAAKALRSTDTWDPSKELKYWLRVAEHARHLGQDFEKGNDIENAFVEYAKAATLILQKIPTHRDFLQRLNSTQRETLSIKGKGVLDRMGELKPVIVDRHNAWETAQEADMAPRSHSTSPTHNLSRRSSNASRIYDRDRAPSRQNNTGSNSTGVQIWYPPAAVEAQERRKQEEAIRLRAATEQRNRTEQIGIIQRQRAAEEEAAAVRKNLVSSTSNPGLPNSSSPSIRLVPRSGFDAPFEPPLLPLESPTRHDDDFTDNENIDEDTLYKRIASISLQNRQQKPSTSPFGAYVHNATSNYDRQSEPYSSSSFRAPITTTSPPPPTLTKIQYPELMSSHQRTQGYSPSLQSMFIQPVSNVPQSNLLFEHAPSSTLYDNILPQQSQAVSIAPRPNPYSSSSTNLTQLYPSVPPPVAEPPRPTVPPRPAPEPPVPRQLPPEPVAKSNLTSHANGERKDPVKHVLRVVNLPRDVLPKFLSIASLNTSMNRETCGLLLGKLKGEKFVVTTLLIPKQHSTSDTCTMDEEELVLEFTEVRSLITLGWIHTHPTQSCFMSSVDLHTHSGFQRMLPESFAVVCAPKSTPNFGIFRLTDPPGLKTILECNAKEAFHPHPDLPIYTDADKGHVQMRDISLEIVDLR